MGADDKLTSRRAIIKGAVLVGAGGAVAHASPGADLQKPAAGSAALSPPVARLFGVEGLPPSIGFSHIAEVRPGRLIYISGQVARSASGDLVGAGDFRAQLEQVFANLDTALRGAGATFADVVKLNYYCVDSIQPAEQRAVVEVRDRYVDIHAPPASTFVFVSRLVRPDWLVEIEAVAAVPTAAAAVVVLAQIDMHPEDLEKAAALARRLQAETVKEDGCIHYAFAVDVAAANRLQLSEHWRDEAALASHLHAPAIREFRIGLSGLRVRRSVVKRYEVDKISDLQMPPL